MKIRKGFVSNSSSSSFVIDKYYLSQEQIDMIKNHLKIALDACMYNDYDGYYMNEWSIKEDDEKVYMYTGMDNFDMYHFLIENVKVLPNRIKDN